MNLPTGVVITCNTLVFISYKHPVMTATYNSASTRTVCNLLEQTNLKVYVHEVSTESLAD